MIELEQLLQYWNEIKGWVIGLGTFGAFTLAINVGLKLFQNRKVNKILSFNELFMGEQDNVNTKLLNVVDAVVDDYKDIKGEVKNVVAKVDTLVDNTNQKVQELTKLITLLIGLLPMNANVKLKVQELLDNIVNIDTNDIIKLLDVNDEKVKSITEKDILDTILEDTEV